MINVISGISGQDGSYLAEILLQRGEKVIGFSRRTGVHSTARIDHLMANPHFTYLEGDITDKHFIWKLISDYKPDKFFNLAAQSHVHTSFENPESTFQIDALGVLNILEAIRVISPNTRFYQASTSELYGSNRVETCGKFYQDEDTPFSPNSPYAIAKLAAHHLVRLYRESYGLWACAGILFNHESPRRGDNFVTQKIIKWIVDYKLWNNSNSSLEENKDCQYEYNICNDHISLIRTNPDNKPYPDKACWLFGPKFPKLRLGNLDAMRDWGHARDYCEAMDLIMSQDSPDDYVVGTGETHSVREFLDIAFSLLGVNDWSNYVVIDPKFIRPCEVPYLCSKPDKIKALGWSPKYDFKSLVKEMYETRLQRSAL